MVAKSPVKQKQNKSFRFTMLMTPEEREMFNEVAASERRTVADWIRVRMHEAHEAMTAAKRKK